ncbi:MAG: HEPN domain-containing protein [Chloroflexia bacterium]
MRAEAKLWMDDARYDLDTARDMRAHERWNYAVFLARQAVEKMLKAGFLILLRRPVPWEHNLLELARECLGEGIPEDVRRPLLNPHDTVARYVDAALGRPAHLYDRSFAETAVQEAERVLAWLDSRFSN